jgi:CO dehydrogenase maturation factor
VKVAFVGKGGSGKTTLASLFVAHLVAVHRSVLAIDADINQHLAVALGATPAEAGRWPALGDHLPLIKNYLRGTNPRISSSEAMIKTTPPGTGSRLLTIDEDNPIYYACVRFVGGARLAVTGPLGEGDLGVACYHSKVGAVELILNHLVDGRGEYAVVDMTAGADSFASGLFTRFDATFVVCEPTLRSVDVYRQYKDYAAGFDLTIHVVGNKVSDDSDLVFLRSEVGEDMVAWFGCSAHVRATERGEAGPIDQLEQANRSALRTLGDLVDLAPKDWAAYQRHALDFHLRNAASWGNARTGVDLVSQIDPDFVPGPPTPVGRRPMSTINHR